MEKRLVISLSVTIKIFLHTFRVFLKNLHSQRNFMSIIKCPTCNLTNFESAEYCKRCKNSLHNPPYSADANTTINQPSATTMRPAEPAPFSQDANFDAAQNNFQYQPYRFQQEDNSQPQNPYYAEQNSAPNANQYYQPAYPQQTTQRQNQGAWRSGTEVVLHKNATLPACCVKCGEPARAANDVSYVAQKFRWHNPLLYIALISPLIYCILAAVMSERFTVDVPLCGAHTEERRTIKNYLIIGSIFLIGAAIFFAYFDVFGVTVLISVLLVLALSIVHEYFYKPLRVKKVDNDYIYLQGASQSFLNSLPFS